VSHDPTQTFGPGSRNASDSIGSGKTL